MLCHLGWRPGAPVFPAPVQELAAACSFSLRGELAKVLGSFLGRGPSPQQMPGLFRGPPCLTHKERVPGDLALPWAGQQVGPGASEGSYLLPGARHTPVSGEHSGEGQGHALLWDYCGWGWGGRPGRWSRDG